MSKENPFSAGIRVVFRTTLQNKETGFVENAIWQHLEARQIITNSEFANHEDYIIQNEAGALLGVFPRDAVLCILPIETVGPSSADLAN